MFILNFREGTELVCKAVVLNNHDSRTLLLSALSAFALVGCGGSSSGSPTFVAGYYRGTFNFQAEGLAEGNSTIIADVQSNGDLTAHAHSTTVEASISKTGNEGSAVYNSIALEAPAQLTTQGSNVAFTMGSPNTFAMTATLAPTAFPVIGETIAVPPAGNYTGELLVVSDGHARAMGTVTATFDGTGSWTALTAGGKQWVNSGIFTGQFQSNGTLTGAFLIIGGNIISQSTTPVYSFDGTNLVVRYDQLALDPGSCWLTFNAVRHLIDALQQSARLKSL